MKLEQDDLSAIAKAVAEELKPLLGGAAPAAADKPAAKTSKPKKDAPTVDRDAVFELARQVRVKHGTDKAKGLIGKYAEAFKDVSDDDLPKLEADLNAALEEDAL